MARPSKNRPPFELTTSELAVASGLSSRNVTFLISEGILPFSDISPDLGKTRSGSYTLEHLNFFASVAAIHLTGAELLLSARLSAMLLTYETDNMLYFDNFESLIQQNAAALTALNGFKRSWGEENWQQGDAFSLGYTLWQVSALKKVNAQNICKSQVGDMVIEIADRRYVYSTPLKPDQTFKPEPAMKISGWERGNKQPRLLPFVHEVCKLAGGPYSSKLPEAQALEHEYQSAIANSISRVSINISLAIRTAFNRLFDSREPP